MPTDDQQLDTDIQKLIERDRLLVKHRRAETVEPRADHVCHRCGKTGVVFIAERLLFQHICRDGIRFEWTDEFERLISMFVSRVAVCAKGINGMVTGVREFGNAWVFVGFRQDDGRPWMSRHPKITDDAPSWVALSAAVKGLR